MTAYDPMTADPRTVWKAFCRDLEAAGERVLSSDLAGSKIDSAEGARYLTRLLRIGLEMHLENADPAFPSFYQASHATAKIGADNPDNYYQNATISGAHSYRIRGQRGTVPILSFGTKANRYAIDGTMASTGELDIRDVKCDDSGAFDIIVSRQKQSENWLPLAEDSSILIVRQTFFNRANETPAKVSIKALNVSGKPAPLSLESLSQALTRVPAFIGGTSNIFMQWADVFRQQHRNTLSTTDQAMFAKAGGDPMIYYLHGWWELEPDQALRITSEIPKCEGWNFQVNNVWMESLDYRHHNIHTNNGLAELNADGSVTIIVSHRQQDGNWIDSAGHSRGTMLWRWTGAKNHPVPKVEIINV